MQRNVWHEMFAVINMKPEENSHEMSYNATGRQLSVELNAK